MFQRYKEVGRYSSSMQRRDGDLAPIHFRITVDDEDFIDDNDRDGEDRYWKLTSFEQQPITPAGRIMSKVVFPIIRVIEVYRDRGLPVGGNVIKAVQFAATHGRYGYNAHQIMVINAKYNKLWSEYAEEIDKYTMLL